MRTWIATVLVTTTFAFAIPRASATDVGYELDTKRLDSADELRPSEQVAVEIRDRVWAAPGVEEVTQLQVPARRFDFATAPRYHFDGDGPCWLDEVAWPLTRQFFHDTEDQRFYSFSM